MHQPHTVDNPMGRLKNGDLLFLDDCLYSQYVFMKGNDTELLERGVNVVLGLSSFIVRNVEDEPESISISSELHNRFHSGDMSALHGFMSIDDVRELLEMQNTYLAFHGGRHLNLESDARNGRGRIDIARDFGCDISAGVERLHELGFDTDIFVYPYAYDFFISDRILKEFGFRYVFAGRNSKRIEIERILH
jgi:hypothetical protein